MEGRVGATNYSTFNNKLMLLTQVEGAESCFIILTLKKCWLITL